MGGREGSRGREEGARIGRGRKGEKKKEEGGEEKKFWGGRERSLVLSGLFIFHWWGLCNVCTPLLALFLLGKVGMCLAVQGLPFASLLVCRNVAGKRSSRYMVKEIRCVVFIRVSST